MKKSIKTDYKTPKYGRLGTRMDAIFDVAIGGGRNGPNPGPGPDP